MERKKLMLTIWVLCLAVSVIVMMTMNTHLGLNFISQKYILKFIPKLYSNDSVSMNSGIEDKPKTNVIKIAIGCAITTRKLKHEQVLTKLPFFISLVPTFCTTASGRYDDKNISYHFYLAHDHDDGYLTDDKKHKLFAEHFFKIVHNKCPSDLPVFLHFVQCNHSGTPPRAQNDAMMAAYKDKMDYHYRVNDDTNMATKGWAEKFIEVLSKYDPPNVGVVGPNHRGGNTAILTYDFVHRTHVDIFGFYYPHLFTDWFADDWVTTVYKPGRSTKLKDVSVIHTLTLGQRYSLQNLKEMEKKVGPQVEQDKLTLKKWIENYKLKTTKKTSIVLTTTRSPATTITNTQTSTSAVTLHKDLTSQSTISSNSITKTMNEMETKIIRPNQNMTTQTTVHNENIATNHTKV